MKYVLNVIQPTGPIPPPETLEPIVRDLTTLREEMQQAGVWVLAGGLDQPETSAVVRVTNGEVLTTDGPFAEAKEHIGGFTIVDVSDRDAALGWAQKLARATTLPIEVRPFRDGG